MVERMVERIVDRIDDVQYDGHERHVSRGIRLSKSNSAKDSTNQKNSAQRENRTLMGLRPRDFESRASTNSAIRATSSRGRSIAETETTFKTKALWRQQLADIVNWIHTGFTLVSVSGWIWWPSSMLTSYIALLAIILVQWIVLGNRCLLTDLEWRLRTGQKWRPGTDEGFIAKLIRKLGVNPSKQVINKLPWYTVYTCMTLASTRFFLQT
jgi:hypothetical protein